MRLIHWSYLFVTLMCCLGSVKYQSLISMMMVMMIFICIYIWFYGSQL